ncbi:hypothetical protein [Olivibacter sp. XZL3]|uniref:hypothetical protein n=1 Tax=Olivibacter sp. XZL3 TaxID=1735116 RepID=UPI001066C78B|nr:hypothetical protein [Olivibacter sp. XZL3]
METLIFKTNIETPASKNKLLSALENISGLMEWKLDIESIYKLLIVSGISINYLEIIRELEKIGVRAVRLYEE